MISAALIAATALSFPHIGAPHFGHKPLPVPVMRRKLGKLPDQHGDPVAVVRYKQDGKLILVPVEITDRGSGRGTYMFVVDSAASRSVVDAGLARKLKLRTRAVPGPAGATQVSALWGSVLKIHDAPSYVPEAYVADLRHGRADNHASRHQPIRGIIGAELFRSYVVRIDPVAGTLRIYNPFLYRPTTGATPIPLTSADGKLYAPLSISVRGEPGVVRSVRVDTGSDVQVADPVAAKAPPAGGATLDDSLGRRTTSPAGLLAYVKMGPYGLRDVWAAKDGGPAVGMEWMRRFIVTFDAPHNRMYLEPVARTYEASADPNSGSRRR